MKFIVSRASLVTNAKPCEEAQEEKVEGVFGQSWTVEIKNLTDLLSFIKNEGEIIISKEKENIYEIMIYDSYVE